VTGRVWATILIAGAGTYLIRVVFFALADRTERMPAPLQRALRYIPPAALSAIAVPPMLRPTGGGVDLLHPVTLAGVVAAVVAFRTKSVPWTMLAGLAAAMAFDAVLPGSVSAPPG
jgi:branched-subunit amino acid transport protein